MSAPRPAEILLVEDSDDCVYLTQRALAKTKLVVNLHHVNDGRKCMQYLRRQTPYGDAPVPDLILLDLDMPVMDGRRVLAEITGDESLKHLAVVVLTSGSEDREILQMYRLGCNSYICKPLDFDKYVEMVKTLADYWLSVVMLPTNRVAGG